MVKTKKNDNDVGLFDGDLWEQYVNLTKAYKCGYCIKQSTYSMEIISPFINKRFMQNLMSNRAFAAYAKIKKDIKEKGLTPPEIKRSMLEYYKFEMPEFLKRAKNTVYNIDLKSAYATVLKNEGVITEDTFNYMARLPKKDRLACVGMLASNKNYFFHGKDGEIEMIQNELNPLTPFFYLCIYRVQQIMNQVKNAIGNDFLFYWVDGIYFNSEKSIPVISKILTDTEFSYSFEVLRDFHVLDNKGRISLKFIKENDKPKIFRVPEMDMQVNKRLIGLLSLHDEENSIIKKYTGQLPEYLKSVK